jgi:bifunctional DNA-binding transcriptional regulator/antitoxin component of YhaV-PrlF toxin-antitoxin module
MLVWDMGESAGVVKMSSDGVIVVPVETREVLEVKNKEAFIRLNDIEVAKVVEEEGGDT